MEDFTLKWLLSVVFGFIATFFENYGLFIVLVVSAIVLDFVTGIIKAKATDEGLSSKKAWKGFWRKVALLAGLSFGIFLDYAVATVLAEAGIAINVSMPFSLVIACYIVLNECISIAENLYLINPYIMPKWISKFLRVAKEDLENKK